MKKRKTQIDKVEEAKKRILTAATDLMQDYGYDFLTVRNICEQAGISTGTFYHYFASKDELLGYYISEGYTTSLSKLQGNIDQQQPHRVIIETLTYFAGYFQSMGVTFVSNFFSPNNQALNIYGLLMFKGQKHVINFFLEQFQNAQELGMIKESEDIHLIYEKLNSIFYGNIFNWCLQNGKYDLNPILMDMLTTQLNQYLNHEYIIRAPYNFLKSE